MPRAIAPLMVLVVAFAACVEAPQVIEGRVTAVDPSANTLTLVDETRPDRTMTLSLEGADIGPRPQVDDVVRIAYLEHKDDRRALRVMNVSRQEEQAGAKH